MEFFKQFLFFCVHMRIFWFIWPRIYIMTWPFIIFLRFHLEPPPPPPPLVFGLIRIEEMFIFWTYKLFWNFRTEFVYVFLQNKAGRFTRKDREEWVHYMFIRTGLCSTRHFFLFMVKSTSTVVVFCPGFRHLSSGPINELFTNPKGVYIDSNGSIALCVWNWGCHCVGLQKDHLLLLLFLS